MATIRDLAGLCQLVSRVEKNIGVTPNFREQYKAYLEAIHETIDLDAPLSPETKLTSKAQETFKKMTNWLSRQHYVFERHIQKQQLS